MANGGYAPAEGYAAARAGGAGGAGGSTSANSANKAPSAADEILAMRSGSAKGLVSSLPAGTTRTTGALRGTVSKEPLRWEAVRIVSRLRGYDLGSNLGDDLGELCKILRQP